MVTPTRPRSVIAEEYRVIKRPLIGNAQGRGAAAVQNGNLIMVTSALPGEGKSFTSINLAMSIAMELDHTVLLVDADFSKPSVLELLGLPPAKGLMDVLVGDVSDLSDVMLRTNVEKLSILPAGMRHQRATELIASDAMNRMLEEMATRYAERVVIFDSPPLLATTEARVLATLMGQVMMVVEAGRTSHAAVKHALSTIEACPVKLLVLNKANERGQDGLYGYGYGYGYGAAPKSVEAA
jgi:receptor protein-tyrosine kinase